MTCMVFRRTILQRGDSSSHKQQRGHALAVCCYNDELMIVLVARCLFVPSCRGAIAVATSRRGAMHSLFTVYSNDCEHDR